MSAIPLLDEGLVPDVHALSKRTTASASVDDVLRHARANPFDGSCSQYQDEPEMRWNFSVRNAVDALFTKKRARSGDLPADIRKLLSDVLADGFAAMERARLSEMTDSDLAAELESALRHRDARRRGEGEEEEVDEIDEDDDYEPDGEYDEDDVDDEDGVGSAEADDPDASLAEAEAAVTWVEAEIAKRKESGYDRLAFLEQRFVEKCGAGSEALRDVLVSYELTYEECPDKHVVLVNGCEVTPGYRVIENLFPDTESHTAERLIEAIAEERRAKGLGVPDGCDVSIVSEQSLAMPQLQDGVARPSRACPCCNTVKTPGALFCERCGQWCNSRSVRVVEMMNKGVTEQCIHARRSGIPFAHSRIGRVQSGRIVFVLPTYGHAVVRGAAVRSISKRGDVRLTVTDDALIVEENLPSPLAVGTRVGVMRVYSVERIHGKRERGLDHWWYDDSMSRQSMNVDGEMVVAYATALDVAALESVPRTEPTVLERGTYGGKVDELCAAIVGDRYGSPFAARVAEVRFHDRRPAAPKVRAGEREDTLTKVVRDGAKWKTVRLEMDPFESFDESELTAAVIADFGKGRRAQDSNKIALGLLNTFGALGVLRMMKSAGAFDEDALESDFYDFTRYEQGYADAADAIASALRNFIHCPDCGVLESCHDRFEIPCGGAYWGNAKRHAPPEVRKEEPQLALF